MVKMTRDRSRIKTKNRLSNIIIYKLLIIMIEEGGIPSKPGAVRGAIYLIVA